MPITMNNIVPIGVYRKENIYGGFKIEAVDSFTMGRAINPESKDPVSMVNKIYQRHKKEFTDQDTFLAEAPIVYFRREDVGMEDEEMLGQFVPASPSKTSQTECHVSQTDGKFSRLMKMRFFTLPYGYQKVLLFSNSPHKVAAILWCNDLIVALAMGTMEKPPASLIALINVKPWTRGIRAKRIEIGEAMGLKGELNSKVRRMVNKLKAGKPLEKPRDGYVHAHNRENRERALKMTEEGITPNRIADILGIPPANVYNWTKKRKRQGYNGD
ncbi:MAG TPA: hypothetical protein DDW17_02040 [Deltaproteobacteria bacterium]|nr:hypothetical protein [Deltaproteobacteria bacterium]